MEAAGFEHGRLVKRRRSACGRTAYSEDIFPSVDARGARSGSLAAAGRVTMFCG